MTPDRVRHILNNLGTTDFNVDAAFRELTSEEADALLNELLRLESGRADKPPDSN